MSQTTNRSLPAKIFRVIRIYALYCVIAAIFASPVIDGLIVTNASAQSGPCGGVNVGDECKEGGICTEAPGGRTFFCAPVPEIPALFIPLFLALSIGSVYYIRRRQMGAYQAA